MAQEDKIFHAKPMKECLKEAESLPAITPLYEPWWNKGETCFFFGSTGVGKTIFAMQMAHKISENKKVLYFDFEMTKRQLLERYQHEGKLIPFSDNLIRVEILEGVEVNNKKIMKGIERGIEKHKAEVIIIDNLTWALEDTQEARTAIPFMKKISGIKKKYGVSVLIIAHTPKRKSTRSMTKDGRLFTYDSPIDLADMAGSAALNNFIDSCFAIGKSCKDESLRYLKQLKSRSAPIVHGEDNVFVCCLEKKEGFLSLVKIGESPEEEHLTSSPKQKEERNQKILDLHKQGSTSRKIGEEVGLSHTHIQRIIKKSKKPT